MHYMGKVSDNRAWRKTICSFIVLLFAWQIVSPMLFAGTPTCTMQCCRRAHGKGTFCQHGSKQTGGPALTEARGCSDDCAAVAPGFSPLVVRSTSATFAIADNAAQRLAVESFVRIATPASSNSFQRPPPVL